MKFDVYTQEGKKKGSVELSDKIFGVAFKPALIKEVVLSILSNMRTPVAHTKGRGDVRGGGRKPWKQKGTGRARHGSSRSPIWTGGGVTHGPSKEKNYSKKVNRKAARVALTSALSAKAKDAELIMLSELSFETPKTKEAKSVLDALAKAGFEKLAYKKKNAALVVLPEKDENTYKSFANFGNVFVKDARNINTYDAVKYKYIIFVSPEKVEEILLARVEGK